jgi:hypothetical protein
MSRNGSGTYSLPAGNPVITGTLISSTWANNTLSDIATALTQSVAVDGQSPITANIPMNSKKLTGLAAATTAGDAISYGQASWSLAVGSITGATTVTAAIGMSGAPINEAQGADVASAATIVLDSTTGNVVDVTGTTTITAITLAQGSERTIRFTGALTLTNGASLVLPGAANILTVAGDFAIFRGYAAGVVRCVYYSRATGIPVAGSVLTNSSGIVALNNTGLYFTGPTVAQGTVGLWFASGTIVMSDSAGAANMNARLTDGTTIIAETAIATQGAGAVTSLSLSGFILNPAGNLRITGNDQTSVNGSILAGVNSKASTITVVRIA